MNIDKINELLDRYYDARTTETEEEDLKQFFQKDEVPPQLATEKEMFLQLLSAAGDTNVPEGLEERLSSVIDRWESRESITIQPRQTTRIRHLQWIGSIAASLLIALSFSWYLYEPAPTRTDTCATPEEAYMEAQRAFTHFSAALNKGMTQMETAQNTTARIEKKILKQLNKINE